MSLKKSLLPPVHTMMMRGIQINTAARKVIVDSAQTRIDGYRSTLNELTEKGIRLSS